MLKLETPWDDDEDEDAPHRHEEDDDTVPDEDDPGEDDDEDDEEPLKAKEPQMRLLGLHPEVGSGWLLFPDYRDRNGHRHVGVQDDLDRDLTHLFERPLRHAHL